MMLALPEPYALRPMEVNDIAEVMTIEQVVKTSPWSAATYETEITQNDQSTAMVLTAEGWIAGYMVHWVVADEIQVNTIATALNWRGRGLGEALLLNGLLSGYQRGGRVALLEVRRSNTVAQNLYRKYGFAVVGERKRYYRDNHEDALLMTVNDLEWQALRNYWPPLRERLAQ